MTATNFGANLKPSVMAAVKLGISTGAVIPVANRVIKELTARQDTEGALDDAFVEGVRFADVELVRPTG